MSLFRHEQARTPPSLPQLSPLRTDPGVQYRQVHHAFGLDISDGSLKAVEFSRRKGGYVLQAHSRVDLAVDVVERGEIRDPEALKEAIKKLLAGAMPRPITTRTVLLSLGEANVYLHPFEFPNALTEAQVRRAVPYEAEGELPITLRDTYVDIQFHRSRKKAHHVLFAAAPRDLMDAYVALLVSTGLQPVVFEIESLALSRCLVRPQDEPVLLLDIGGWSSTITTVERGMVHGAVSVPVGGSLLTEVLAKALGISPSEAERVKRTDGLAGAQPKAREALGDALLPLIEEIHKAASYHQTHTGRPVKQLVLSGGSALLEGLIPFLADRTTLTVTLGDPLAIHSIAFSSRYSEDQRAAFSQEKIMYANSIGLAIRGGMPDIVASGLNLLPPPIKQRYLHWWKHALIAALSILTAVSLLGSVTLLGVWSVQLAAERMRVAQRMSVLKKSFAGPQFQEAVKEGAETNAEITILKQFDDRRTNVSQIFAELRSVTPETVKLASLTVVNPAEREKPMTIELTGVAARREDFLAFEQLLRSRNDVKGVDSPITNLNRPVNTPFWITLTFVTKPAVAPSPTPPRP